MANDFTMYQGDSKTIAYSVVDGDGAAVDVSGASVTFAIARNLETTAVLTKTSATSAVVVSGSSVTVTLSAADTAALFGLYFHELQITDSSGNVSTTRGMVNVEDTVI